MANYSTLIADITAKIYENAGNDITGQDLQDVLLEMVTEMGQSGMVCLGIADGNTNPPGSSDSNIFYIAGEGTYSNFGGLTVNAGEIALFIWDGATWQKQSVTTTDPNKADKVAGATAGDLAGLDGSGNLTDSGVPSNNVAQQDGYYSTLTAGSAENLIGRGTVPAEYTRRTSGGSADIGSGAAAIEKIHGNTIVWNQLKDISSFTTGNATASISDGVITFLASAQNGYLNFSTNLTWLVPHKYLIAMDLKGASASATVKLQTAGSPDYNNGNEVTLTTSWQRYAWISTRLGTAYTGTAFPRLLDTRSGGWDNVYVKGAEMVDLTLLFGYGKEPTTVAEFEALFPLNYYAYNAGSLVSLTGTGIETNGFNQVNLADLPTQTGMGSIDSSGAWYVPTPITNKTIWKNDFGYTGQMYIKFDVKYSGTSAGLRFVWRYTDGTYAIIYPTISTSYVSISSLSASGKVVSELSTDYGSTAIQTWIQNLVVNFSWSGYRNGEYEAYWDSTLALPITTVTSGGSAVFADGMKSAGTVYDELTSTKAVKRIAKVDMGSLSWTYSGSIFVSTSLVGQVTEPTGLDEQSNIVCAKYVGMSCNDSSANDKSMCIVFASSGSHGQIWVRDSAYTDAATFKTSLNGVYLYYALKTPTEYTLDSEVNLNYRVDDFGTETLLPQNNATPTTAPIIYDVRYAMNAVDTLRNLPKNYISKDSMEHILNAMVTAGVISAYTLTWNATNENYDCTITA